MTRRASRFGRYLPWLTGALTAGSAYIGARYATRTAIAVWTGVAMAAMFYSFVVASRYRARAVAVRRGVNAESLHVTIVSGDDYAFEHIALTDILDHPNRYGIRTWSNPVHVAIYSVSSPLGLQHEEPGAQAT